MQFSDDLERLALVPNQSCKPTFVILGLGILMTAVSALPLVLFHYLVFPMLGSGMGWGLDVVAAAAGLVLSIGVHLFWNEKIALVCRLPLGLITLASKRIRPESLSPQQIQNREIAEEVQKIQDVLKESRSWREKTAVVLDVRDLSPQTEMELKKVLNAYANSMVKSDDGILVLAGGKDEVEQWSQEMGIWDYIWVEEPSEVILRLKKMGDYAVKVFSAVPEDWKTADAVFLLNSSKSFYDYLTFITQQ
jgi:hypothetical protein